MLSWRRAGRRCAGFFLLGVLAVVSLSACDPAPQATSVPDQTEASDTTQAPTSDSTPTPTPVPDQTEASDATQIPTSDSTPTPTPVPDQTEALDATQIPTSDSTPTPTPVPDQTEALDATQIPTSDSTPTPTPLPDLVIAIEARLKSNPDIVYGDGCIASSSARLSPHVGEVTAHVRNVGGGDAGSFTVQLNNFNTETVDGLKAGASTTVVLSESARSENVAVVDAGSSIDESDESNNTAEAFIPVPTIAPPPTCTPESR